MRIHLKAEWFVAAIAIGTGATTAMAGQDGAGCKVIVARKNALPARLSLYRIDGDQIVLARTEDRQKLPEPLNLKDCGDPAHFGVVLEKFYLVNRSEIYLGGPCTKVASPERAGGTAGGGELPRCEEKH